MLFLGIDQHARQLTVSLSDQQGDVLLARQVSTRPGKILQFFDQLTHRCAEHNKSFIAVVEVTGFNDWLIRMLRNYRCHKVILIQPQERHRWKTDRRNAAALSELLWVNRDRFLFGKPVRGLRQVEIANSTDQQNRRLTTLRKEAGHDKTQLINKIRHIFRRHNLQWELPTKTFPTTKAITWLKQLDLPELERLEMNYLLDDLDLVQQRLQELEKLITQRCRENKNAPVLCSAPGLFPPGVT